jgi:hypothetical protein
VLSWPDLIAVPGQAHVGRLSDPAVGEHLMADHAARIAQLEAELRQSRAENEALRQREAALVAEVEGRDASLAASEEHQQASGAILRVIASSPTELQRVLDTIAATAARLCQIDDVLI